MSGNEIILSENSTYNKDEPYSGFDEIIDIKEIACLSDETIWRSGEVGETGADEYDIPVENFYTQYEITASQRSNATLSVSIRFGGMNSKEAIKSTLMNLILNF